MDKEPCVWSLTGWKEKETAFFEKESLNFRNRFVNTGNEFKRR